MGRNKSKQPVTASRLGMYSKSNAIHTRNENGELLPDLPADIWHEVNKYLPLDAQASFAQASKGTYALTWFKDKRTGTAYNQAIRNAAKEPRILAYWHLITTIPSEWFSSSTYIEYWVPSFQLGFNRDVAFIADKPRNTHRGSPPRTPLTQKLISRSLVKTIAKTIVKDRVYIPKSIKHNAEYNELVYYYDYNIHPRLDCREGYDVKGTSFIHETLANYISGNHLPERIRLSRLSYFIEAELDEREKDSLRASIQFKFPIEKDSSQPRNARDKRAKLVIDMLSSTTSSHKPPMQEDVSFSHYCLMQYIYYGYLPKKEGTRSATLIASKLNASERELLANLIRDECCLDDAGNVKPYAREIQRMELNVDPGLAPSLLLSGSCTVLSFIVSALVSRNPYVSLAGSVTCGTIAFFAHRAHRDHHRHANEIKNNQVLDDREKRANLVIDALSGNQPARRRRSIV